MDSGVKQDFKTFHQLRFWISLVFFKLFAKAKLNMCIHVEKIGLYFKVIFYCDKSVQNNLEVRSLQNSRYYE